MKKTKSNRELLLDLLAKLGMTQKQAAEFLAGKTMRPCSLRTVQAWANDPESEHSRNCPDWAIGLLQEELARRG